MSPGSQANLPHRSMRAELPFTVFSMARLRERSYCRKVREERRRETGESPLSGFVCRYRCVPNDADRRRLDSGESSRGIWEYLVMMGREGRIDRFESRSLFLGRRQ